jgi:hypothetical protein
MQVTSDHEGDWDAFLCVGVREMGSTFLHNGQQVPESSAPAATVSLFSLGKPVPSPRRSVPRVVCRPLLDTCMWNVVCLLCGLPLLVLELGI